MLALVALAMMAMLAQVAEGTGTGLEVYGLAGVTVGIVLWGYRQERARADQAQADRANDLRSVLPIMEQSTAESAATRQVLEAFLAEYQRDQRDLRGRS